MRTKIRRTLTRNNRETKGQTGLEIKFFFFQGVNCIFESYLKVVSIDASTSLGSLQKFEGVTKELWAPGTP